MSISMSFTTNIPISIIYRSQLFTGNIFYSAVNITGYKADLVDLMEEIVKYFRCGEDVVVQRMLMRVVNNALTRVARFWLNEVFRPLSQTEIVPEYSRCWCSSIQRKLNTCLHDIITSSYYDEKGEKCKLDLFSGPPSVSINVAAQGHSEVISLRAYYANILKTFHLKPCCMCCPISKHLMKDIEQLITATNETLADVSVYQFPSTTC